MTKHIQDAYIVAVKRTPVGKAPRGVFRHTRPDDLLAHVLRETLDECAGIDVKRISDVVIGCAMPEAEQGMNVARIGALLAGLPNSIPGMTINRFCSSGLQSVAIAANSIRLGETDLILAGGTESMSMVPMMGFHPVMNPEIFKDENSGIAYGMGITAENVATQWKITREEQDAFALRSHQRALAAQDAGNFKEEIAPYPLDDRYPDLAKRGVKEDRRVIENDEGPRRDTSAEVLAKLRHGRQFIADVRWRRRGAAGQRTGDQGLRPDAACAFRWILGRRRAAGNHGHRSQGSHSKSAESHRHQTGST